MSYVAGTPGPLASAARPRVAQPLISLVVPVYNEADSIRPFMAALNAALPSSNYRLEVVFVNDGSRDGTLAVLLDVARSDERMIVVDLSRNFGKEAALTAGLEVASGDVVVPIDVDLQDPPELIARMLAEWRAGYDVVLAVRVSRRSEGPIKALSASGFYQVFNTLSSVPIPANAGDFRLMDRAVVTALAGLRERNRFMKGLFAWVGFRTTTIEYMRPPRTIGRTTWSYPRLWTFALDGIFSFSTAPLKIWMYVGFAVAGLAVAYSLYIFVKTIVLGIDVPGYASIMDVVLILGAIQIISIGIVGQYIGRIFLETKQRPIYLVNAIYARRAAPLGSAAPPIAADATETAHHVDR